MAYGQSRVERERERQCTIEHTHAKSWLRLCMGCAIEDLISPKTGVDLAEIEHWFLSALT